jgi:hypothetical protein
MENNIPKRRTPTPKLKFPLFGNSGESNSSREGDINPRHMMYLLGAMILFMVGYEYYSNKTGKHIVKSASGIFEMEWKGKVTKKFMGYNMPNVNMFEMVDSAYHKKTIDISDDKSGFFGMLMPRDSVYKIKNSDKVRIKNYTRDTTIVLQFAK